jgi:serine/threonine protein kinase
MEFIDGSDLKSLIQAGGPISLSRFMSVLGQLCSALAYLHSQGIVHRDIQPRNLMLDSHGTLKLIDFGIAREYARDRSQPAQYRNEYTAPEIVDGGEPSPASDIFAAGLVFFEMLTGVAISVRPSRELPPRRSEFPEIPIQLVRLVENCIEPNPSRRFRKMEDLY